jgi:hypothetical protein
LARHVSLRRKSTNRQSRLLSPTRTDLIQAPTTMPWGNRSLLFRDPDGNLVNFFTPVTPQARKKFQLD